MPAQVNTPALTRTREAMRAAGADLLLIDHAELLFWLTGFTVSETMYRACLVPLHGEPWMVLRALDAAPCEKMSWIGDIVTYHDDENPWQCVANSIITRGFQHAALGADYHSYGMTVYTLQQLAGRLPEVRWIEMSGVSDSLRQAKFPVEIEKLRQAAKIADRAYLVIEQQVRAGWRVRDVAALCAGIFLREGADSGETGPIVRSAGDSGFLHAQTHDETLSQGDILHVELTPKVDYYSARLMRPFVVGGPTAQQSAVAAQLMVLQDQQIAAMKPGVCACDIDAIVRDGVLKAGLRGEYGNVTGYALGIYGRTPRPSDFSHCFTPEAHGLLEENSVFHMYTSAQGLAFSETVWVTPEGGVRLNQLPRKIFSLP